MRKIRLRGNGIKKGSWEANTSQEPFEEENQDSVAPTDIRIGSVVLSKRELAQTIRAIATSYEALALFIGEHGGLEEGESSLSWGGGGFLTNVPGVPELPMVDMYFDQLTRDVLFRAYLQTGGVRYYSVHRMDLQAYIAYSGINDSFIPRLVSASLLEELVTRLRPVLRQGIANCIRRTNIPLSMGIGADEVEL